MPEDTFRPAPLRLSTLATIVAVCLCAATGSAQDSSQPTVNDHPLQALFDGAPATTPATLDEPLDRELDDAALDQLEAELDAAIAEHAERTTFAAVPPSPTRPVLLVLASLALLAFVASVLALAMREAKKDAVQRKRTYRRRLKRRDPSGPARAS